MVIEMERLTAYVSGKVQKAGYRTRVVDIARDLGLKGFVQNLEDGRVEIIAEGEDDRLEQFLKAIYIRNATIHVDSISWDYSDGTSNFADFYRMDGREETASRLDDGIEILKGILEAIKDMHSDLGNKQDQKLEKQGKILDAIKDMHADLGCKQDRTIEEIKGLREDVQPELIVQIQHVQSEVQAIKDRLGMP
jgi:acylphosphatase